MLTHGDWHDFTVSVLKCKEARKIYRDHPYGLKPYHIISLYCFILHNKKNVYIYVYVSDFSVCMCVYECCMSIYVYTGLLLHIKIHTEIHADQRLLNEYQRENYFIPVKAGTYSLMYVWHHSYSSSWKLC